MAGLIPAMTSSTTWSQQESVEAGGLMSYGPSFPSQFRRAGDYVDKILRGTKAADIPVEQPTKFNLVINLISEGPRPHRAGQAARDRRRGDRITLLSAHAPCCICSRLLLAQSGHDHRVGRCPLSGRLCCKTRLFWASRMACKF